MWKVDGVRFLGCDFIDSMAASQNPSNIQAVGIWTIDASFSVLPRCTDAITTCWNCTQNDLDFSSFTGLNIGVYASQKDTVNTFVVDRTRFINNIGEKPHFVTAYPNPVNQWVAFDYTLPPQAEKARLRSPMFQADKLIL